ncbi:hypothetical protein KI387_022353, partial [Taxus chinensis]
GLINGMTMEDVKMEGKDGVAVDVVAIVVDEEKKEDEVVGVADILTGKRTSFGR